MKLYFWGIVLFTGMGIVSCQNNNKEAPSSYNEYQKPEETKGVQRMNDYHYQDTATWRGEQITYEITRKVEDSLAYVKDQNEIEYADNYIELILKKENIPFFTKRFTKKTFASHLPKDFNERAILEGMAFDKATPEGIRFAVSVSYPMSDLCFPLLITIASNGEYTVVKDEVLDNAPLTEEENTAS